MKKMIILELIPTSINKETGQIAQLSALKVEDYKLLGRLDLRIKEDKMLYPELKEMLNYDKELFKYLNTKEEIIEEFKNFSKDLPLVMIDNKYTEDYLSDLDNEIIYFDFLVDIKNSDNIINDIKTKYKLADTFHFVDLMFEALIFKSNEEL